MPLNPVINGGVTPDLRRPRLRLEEGTAISGPFPLELFAAGTGFVDPYHPGPVTIEVVSGRLAITPTIAEPELVEFGTDYTYPGRIHSAGTSVGYLWGLSVDSDNDGYDDLEAAAAILLAGALKTSSQGIIENPGEPEFGAIGEMSLSGSCSATADNPLAAVGEMTLAGSCVMTADPFGFSVTGEMALSGLAAATADNPLAAIGLINLSGSVAMTVSNPTVTRYYPTAAPATMTTNAPADAQMSNLADDTYANFDMQLQVAVGAGAWSTLKTWAWGAAGNHTATGTVAAAQGATTFKVRITDGTTQRFLATYTLPEAIGTTGNKNVSVMVSETTDETEWFWSVRVGANTWIED